MAGNPNLPRRPQSPLPTQGGARPVNRPLPPLPPLPQAAPQGGHQEEAWSPPPPPAPNADNWGPPGGEDAEMDLGGIGPVSAPPSSPGVNTMALQKKVTERLQRERADKGGEGFFGGAMLNQLLDIAESEKASDLHLCAGAPPVLRINGKLTPVEAKLLSPEDTESALRQILSDREMERFYEHRALDCTHTTPDGKNRFRVSAYVQRGAITVVYRRIPNNVLNFQALGLPPAASKLHTLKDGMVLCVGPTGSGKSTTLATIIDQINENFNHNIITIEDPIEYVHKHKRSLVNQRELHSDVNSFADALHFALREDPNVIMVGELRDIESLRTAVTAAETGHLVLSTLHAIDTVSTIDRICAMFPAEEQEYIRLQLSMVLRAIIAQRLIPTKDGSKRVLCAELLLVTTAVANMIRLAQPALIYQALETGASHGMVAFDKSLIELCKRGLVDADTAIRQARAQKKVAEQLGKAGAISG
ncbi:MAG: type IV pilus twitching motility protein PilT [Planctomycetes bacterium]|nr:type IV pilus twitching motility protein PilT [Planctomycetota bacterium]